MKILMIGADPSFRGDKERFEKKYKLYTDLGHDLSFIDMLTGVPSILEDSKTKFYCFGGRSKFFALINNFRGIYRLYKKGEKFDVVTSQDLLYTGLLGLFAAKLFKVNLVPQVHGDYVDNPLWLKQSKLRNFENMLAKEILKRVKYVRTVSKRINQDLEKYTVGKTVLSSPIGCNPGYFAPEVFPEVRNKQILFVGRLIEEKNPLLFCEIAKELLRRDNTFKILFAGRGIMQKELEKFFLENKLTENVTFSTAYEPDEKYRSYYHNSLCYLHTALWEGWGMPMIDSMSSGCPVLTTDSGCAGEAVLDGVHGFILEPKVDLWVDKIMELYNNPVLQKKFAENGARDGKVWGVESQTKKFIDLLHEAAKK